MLLTKYEEIIFSEDNLEINIKRLINQLWKLIPMRENNEEWKKQLNTVKLEIVGMHKVLVEKDFQQLLYKLEGLEDVNIDFDLYRKTVFESISLLQKAANG